MPLLIAAFKKAKSSSSCPPAAAEYNVHMYVYFFMGWGEDNGGYHLSLSPSWPSSGTTWVLKELMTRKRRRIRKYCITLSSEVTSRCGPWNNYSEAFSGDFYGLVNQWLTRAGWNPVVDLLDSTNGIITATIIGVLCPSDPVGPLFWWGSGGWDHGSTFGSAALHSFEDDASAATPADDSWWHYRVIVYWRCQFWQHFFSMTKSVFLW